MSLHCLNTELSAELTALVECSQSEWEEIKGHWVAAPSIQQFETWFDENYVEEDWFKTPLHMVYVKKI